MKEVIDLITKKIQQCNEMCFCHAVPKEDRTKDEKRCGNCHSKDILIELLQEVNNLELTK